jgi:hypothetical protein
MRKALSVMPYLLLVSCFYLIIFSFPIYAEDTTNTSKEEKKWQGLKELDRFTGYEGYLREYPDGKYASEAKKRIKEREKKLNDLYDKLGYNFFIDNYKRMYINYVAPQHQKCKTARGMDLFLAYGGLTAALVDMKEQDAVWVYCVEKKASTAQKEEYSKFAEKVKEAEKTIMELVK